ncbi:YihY/virulence factor BrkB family protein [Propionibacteriaceae bacterium Y1923]|uniref:YihY/virulence factor BrkB family protein n=1 Tax=Aestuariimicrobium sp. Y1814 TaxID=3418742 RepID=UPI003C20EC0B
MITGTVPGKPAFLKRLLEDPDPGWLKRLLLNIVRMLWRTIGSCLRYRVTGLAAESAFFMVLSLPPLLFGLAGGVGFIAQRFSAEAVANFRNQLLELASHLLTDEALTQVLAPTLDEVLGRGRVDVVSIGFVIALWSGSRALAVFLDTVTIMYGHHGQRGPIHSRALSVGAYFAMLALAAFFLPLAVAGPGLLRRLLPDQWDWLVAGYWPVVLIGSVALLTTILNWAVPVRRRWWADLPGAALTLAVWLGGSALVRLMLAAQLGTGSLYGPLSAPIGLLVWLYLSAFAVLLGAALNAAIESVWPRFSGISEQTAHELQERSEEPSDAGTIM